MVLQQVDNLTTLQTPEQQPKTLGCMQLQLIPEMTLKLYHQSVENFTLYGFL